MLTARSEEVDRIVGLELGADDYIVKPFSPREVVARVRAVLRRVGEATGEGVDNGSIVRIRDLEIDEGAHEVRMSGQVVAVTPAEFRILSVLVQNAGQVLTRSQLLDLVHDDGSIFERLLLRCPYVRAREYLPLILESGGLVRVDSPQKTVFARFKRGRHPLHANDPWHAYWMVRPLEASGAVLEIYGDYWPPADGEAADILSGARTTAIIARALLERIGAEIDSKP
jgi:CheY-like chemotaxis protein